MRKPIVAGNWKMNGNRSLVSEFSSLMHGVDADAVDVIICPPACFLGSFVAPDFALGGQTLSELDNGAHTGDISAEMLKEFGCRYVIVGHSERREDHCESNALVAAKALKAIESGLVPIICVGESLATREAGELEGFLAAQLDALTESLTAEQLTKTVIAYEPIWAIGTGVTASPEQAQDAHAFIRGHLAKFDANVAANIQILYGGSVKADNAEELFAQTDIDGGLIGGASLKVDDFRKICQAAG
ncbi:triose-phosphate isomerase [Aestuariibacter sp. GS-14]|uniref:triose-phosphate isomerase n=1 Tax=Aestuariibacter sp. GS-14 TaxID=2590670 RepID=UPI00112AA952|nr:triose-phosphate isomerase [Aestuariibacter sp. GS-14]TPV61029.1 triose-phosphate isomerase [Aestuariibacter sp. GS-14]